VTIEDEIAADSAEILGVAQVLPTDDFFQLGGHSLLATQVIARIRQRYGVSVPIEVMFEAPTVADLAAFVRDAGPQPPPAVPAPTAPANDLLPVTSAQQGQWFLHRLDPASPAYNCAEAVRLRGPLDLPALRRAVRDIVARHDALRTRFVMTPAGLAARATLDGELPVPVHDLTALPQTDRAAACDRTIARLAAAPFDLSAGPLWRALLVRLAPDDHAFAVVAHHAVTDGWSMRVLWRELAICYAAACTGAMPGLPPLPARYADHAAWQRQWLAGAESARYLAYWRQVLAGAPQLLVLPTDRPRPAVAAYRGARIPFTVDAAATARLRAVAAASGATVFMTVLAAFATLLGRYAGQDDLVIGTPIAGRTRAELEPLIGMFVNILAVRVDLSGAPSFRQLLRRVRDSCLGAYAHQELPFDRLVAELSPGRGASHNPLFQVMCVFHNAVPAPPPLAGLATEPVEVRDATAKFDLKLVHTEHPDELVCALEYSTDLFDNSTAERIVAQYRQILEAVAAEPDTTVHRYSLVTPTAARVLPDPRQRFDKPVLRPVTELFGDWVARTPEAPACRRGQWTASYRETWQTARDIAAALLAGGLPPSTPVAVLGECGFGLVAAMLGVLFAGGVVLPVDPALPAARRRVLLREGRAVAVVRVPGTADDSPSGLPVIEVDPETGALRTSAGYPKVLPPVPLDAPAYILFTSGTTGTPKAVLGSHKGLSHFVCWERDTFGVGPGDRVAQLTNVSFDPVLRDVFVPLASGATIVMPGPEDNRADNVLAWLAQERITLLHAVPALAGWWLDRAGPLAVNRRLRHVLFAGEPLFAELVQRWRKAFPAAQVANLYGPTETTQSKSFLLVPPAPAPGVQPIGRPLPQAQLLLLNAAGAFCGPGELGEIVIRTPYRTLGYLNSPKGAGGRFRPNPFTGDPSDLVYYSGDLGRYGDDGTVQITGRADDQVKIRGVRIEPGEVEAVLGRHHAVARGAVVARELADRGRRLVAYVVPRPGWVPTAAELTAYVASELPAAMVPAAFVFLQELPLNVNGKTARDRLPAPTVMEAAPTAPRNSTEELLVQLWGQVLGVPAVGVDDSFFVLGGDSLLAFQLIAHIRDAFGVDLPIVTVFQAQTPAALGAQVAAARRRQPAAAIPRLA